MNALLELQGVGASYRSGHNRNVVLRDLTFSVNRSEMVGMVGPSGCGKTTVLKAIAGLIQLDSGHILIDGQTQGGVHPEVGYVFQDPRLLPWRTVMDNVLLPLQVAGVSKPQARLTAERALTLVGLTEALGSYPAELSGGMRQRAAIARALCCDPAILLMDEPFASLDAISRERLNLEMLSLRNSTGKTVLFVTHSIAEAALMADRVLVLSARPARVLREITVGLGPERDPRIQDSAAFTALTAAIRDALEVA